MVHMLLRVLVYLFFVVAGLKNAYLTILISSLRCVTTDGLMAPECKVC